MADVVEKTKSTKDRVIPLLKQYPETRDSDEILAARLWWRDLSDLGENPKTMTARDFLIVYGQNKLTDGELIARSRRLAQIENPELRGTGWSERHGLDKETRKKLGDTNYKPDGKD
jgi:hypothetical protein